MTTVQLSEPDNTFSGVCERAVWHFNHTFGSSRIASSASVPTRVPYIRLSVCVQRRRSREAPRISSRRTHTPLRRARVAALPLRTRLTPGLSTFLKPLPHHYHYYYQLLPCGGSSSSSSSSKLKKRPTPYRALPRAAATPPRIEIALCADAQGFPRTRLCRRG